MGFVASMPTWHVCAELKLVIVHLYPSLLRCHDYSNGHEAANFLARVCRCALLLYPSQARTSRNRIPGQTACHLLQCTQFNRDTKGLLHTAFSASWAVEWSVD
jgi:hypothetical protein